ncbi:NupC/NupG family nucleoside CNT transporter [Leptodesmis sichuanensis]|uniref:NupC/NupG family nucleoside CNT transporter n=1 Tax=Leptodesmis sichuanensis TaxID=2906798 RepID=UPI001F2956DA|nr:nucleoside transporter C-terminal domain-containing protein [Leptodesmis sichuanensis]UIE36560.1 nucleoside:proton symporter [Leptodesmis sichuanensis A121]
MSILNLISLLGIFGLCFIAWLFSENRSLRVFPWRLTIMGILLQLVFGAAIFLFPPTREALQVFSDLLNVIFDAADYGANFVFGRNIVPLPDKPADVNLGYIFAFRALPTVIFFSGLMALLYNLGIIQVITNVFAKIFYSVMRLSGAEALSGAANIFVGIEAAIVVKPFLADMTRSELCAILACCFGTAASSTLAIYVSFLKPVFPNILGHLISASIMAIPACFVVAKILVPETQVPLTLGGLPKEKKASRLRTVTSKRQLLEDAKQLPMVEVPVTTEDEELTEVLRREARVEAQERGETESVPQVEPEGPQETVAGEPIERVSPLDAAIVGALDGVKMAVSIAAVLILILGLVYLFNQIFVGLALLPSPIGNIFKVVTLSNILGFLFLPLTFLTGVSLNPQELWESSVIIGRRLFETAIPPYQALAQAAALPVGQRVITDRAVLIISYALSGFAHLASVGIFVGGTIALIPSRRKDISELGWKALFAGTLATLMIAAVSGVYYTPGNASILGVQQTPTSSVSPASTATRFPAASTRSPAVALSSTER